MWSYKKLTYHFSVISSEDFLLASFVAAPPSQANHGGVKGKLPKSVVNQDPTCVSQSQEAGGDPAEEREAGSSEEEGEEPRAREETEEVLNQSDDDEDVVRIILLSLLSRGQKKGNCL